MTFTKITNNQFAICNWIRKNLKPIKRIERGFSSSMLLNIANQHLGGWVTHEEFKQAMIRCGFYADTSNCDEYYTEWFFNVSPRSVMKILHKEI